MPPRAPSFRPRVRRAAMALAVILVAALALPLPALAAGPLETLDVRLLSEAHDGQPLLLVSGTLPADTPLPAELSLRVPAGAEIVWAGEILGATNEEDVPLEPRVEAGDPYDVVTLTLTRSRTGQVEVSATDAVARGADAVTATLAYEASEPAALARAAVAVPRGSQVTSATPGAKVTATQDGTTYYYFELQDLKAGDPLGLTVSFVPGAAASVAAPGAAGSSGGGGMLLPFLVITAAMGVPVLILAVRRSKRRQAEAPPVAGDATANAGSVFEEEDASVATDAGTAEADHTARESASGGGDAAVARRGSRARLVIPVVAVALIAAFAFVATGGGEPAVGVIKTENGVISQRVSKAEPLTTTRFKLTISCDCPPETEAPEMFNALSAVPGVAEASLQTATMVMEIAFDPSVTDEQAISAALAAADYSPQPAR